MAILSVNNLTIGYEDQEVLSGLNFSINEGDYLCIVGENGSGKTTLVRTLLGLIPPRDGEIVRGEGFAAGEIGYLPQQTQVQRDFPASVR
ncbi:MAG: ATP-binding cassette domain-containing protein, partial [Firmicutes bacterium]|nr:ATP-binding cassette domain-containing protein [Bacillota bacterium]